MGREAEPFRWTVRVYYEDTDAGGVVYHARYLHFFERARTEWLRACGIGQRELAAESGLVFAVRGMTIEFVAPARLDDELVVTASLTRLGRASLELEQTMRRGGSNVATATVRVACLEAQTFRPRRIPASIVELLH